MEKAPFPLLFSIGILFHLFYIANGFLKANTYQSDYHGGS